jgi:hypothetical protein
MMMRSTVGLTAGVTGIVPERLPARHPQDGWRGKDWRLQLRLVGLLRLLGLTKMETLEWVLVRVMIVVNVKVLLRILVARS